MLASTPKLLTRRATAYGAAALLLITAAQSAAAQQGLSTDQPIAEVAGQPPLSARQSSDYRDDTAATVALPAVFETLAVPDSTTPAYTQVEKDPWWQMDFRVQRYLSTVAVRPCEGLAGTEAFGVAPVRAQPVDTGEARRPLACNSDYDLAGAWLLVSNLPLPRDPWAAAVPHDPTALISRFPIISNGYQQPQVATVNRSTRYLRIQFPPGTTRALAIEKLDVRGRTEIADPVFALSTAFDAAFPETLALIDHLLAYRDAASFTENEIERLEGRGRQLERVASKAKSIAARVDKLDSNLGSAIALLDKVEVISPLRSAARATKQSLQRVRSGVQALKDPARRAKDGFESARRSLHEINGTLKQSRLQMRQSIIWSASEETAVAGLYQCRITDPVDPTQLISQPVAAPLEGYSGFRNTQFDLTEINTHTRRIGRTAKSVNDNIQNVEGTANHALQRLTTVENGLIRIETQLNALLVPLRSLNKELGRQICVPLTGLCLSVDDVLKAVQDAKDFFGLSILEGLAYDLLDPIISEILRPITATFPRAPTYAGPLSIELPDYSELLEGLNEWVVAITSMRDLLQSPSIFDCTETDDVFDKARTADPLWARLNQLAYDAADVTS